MPSIKFNNKSDADALNARVTQDCIIAQVWNDGVTNNYCNPTQDENGFWEVPIEPGFERFFTSAELDQANDNDPILQEILANQAKGQKVQLEYLKDNKQLTLTTTQSLQQLAKFANIKMLLDVGDINSAYELLTNTATDEIFTKPRKDKYLSMLS